MKHKRSVAVAAGVLGFGLAVAGAGGANAAVLGSATPGTNEVATASAASATQVAVGNLSPCVSCWRSQQVES